MDNRARLACTWRVFALFIVGVASSVGVASAAESADTRGSAGKSVATTGSSSCGVPVTSIEFSDTFPGTSLDPAKWTTGGVGTGGTISVTPGVAQFNVSGDILFAQTINNPIPATGDFSVYCKGQHYTSGSSHGSLCSAHHNTWPAVGSLGADTYWSPGTRYGGHWSTMVVSIGPPGYIALNYSNPADIGSTHEWELCVRGNTAAHFKDGVSLGMATLPPGWIRPQFLALGNPGSPGPPFTSMETNAIEVRRLATSVAPGLVGHWAFDQCSGVDSSGLGNNGALVNGIVCEAGVSGTGIRLNSTNYAEIPHSASLSLTTAFTLATWFKADALTPYYPLRLIDKITAGSGDGYMFPVWSNGLAACRT